MKAVFFSQYGGPEVLNYGELPDPVPAADEFLIRVRAIGVNPADGKWRSGMLHQIAPLSFPHVGGYDVAGEVMSGSGLAPGTRVAAMVDTFRAGAYAELSIADMNRIAVLPDGMDFATAAAIPTPGLTGVQVIEEELAVQPGQRVLVTGGAGAVGRFAVHASRQAGATVVAAVRASAREDALALGANEVIVLDGSDYAGPAFDLILDTVGGAIVAPLCRAVAQDGRISTVATTPVPAEGVPVPISFYGVHPDGKMLNRILGWVASGAVPVVIADRLPLSRAAEAQHRVDGGTAGGKIILEP